MPDKKPLEERKALNLIKVRQYKQLERTEEEDTLFFTAQTPKKKQVLIFCILNRKVVGVRFARKLKKLMDKSEIKRGMIVANSRYTAACKRESKQNNIELIPKHFPSFNIFEHDLVPMHEILSSEEAKQLLVKYHIKPFQLPQIKASDAAVVAIGAKRGDIVKITRKSPTAGKYAAYRLVVP